jgi:hypothetical protein
MQDCAKERIDFSVLCIPMITPGPAKSWIVIRTGPPPPAGVKTSSAFPGPGTWYSRLL